jgi:hypothetical protein
MKILFVADARSPTSAGWISYFTERDIAVHLVSTYPADPLPGLAAFDVVPVAFSSAGGRPGSRTGGFLRAITGARLRTAFRQRLGVWTLQRSARRLEAIFRDSKPDLIHALRIPFEGMLASQAQAASTDMAIRNTPLVISIWGNDLTLHAPSNWVMAQHSRAALASAAAVMADCHRDIRLAAAWGLRPGTPTHVVPGGGGVRSEQFHPGPDSGDTDTKLNVIQPRGVRAYVQNKAFFEAIPLVLEAHPGTRFICPAMIGHEEIESMARGITPGSAINLLPAQSRDQMADWFRRSAIILSPTTHDGTPNTVLEAMASGCFPIAGDLEPLREWITDGENGLLVDSTDPRAIAQAISSAITDTALRKRSRTINLQLIDERAERETVMQKAERFYQALLT